MEKHSGHTVWHQLLLFFDGLSDLVALFSGVRARTIVLQPQQQDYSC